MKLINKTITTFSVGIATTLSLLGTSASAADFIERKNIVDLTPEERSAYVNAVKTLKSTIPEGSEVSIYDQFVALHVGTMGFSMEAPVNSTYPNGFMYMDMDNMDDMDSEMEDPEHSNHGQASGPAVGADAAHNNAAFLPWHREYTYRFEQALQSVDPNVTLPYWDWSDSEAWDIIFDEDFLGFNGTGQIVELPYEEGSFAGGAVQSGHFSEANGWVLDERLHFGPTGDPRGTSLLRFLQLPPFDDYPLPKEDVEKALAIENYENFRLALEGWPFVDNEGNLVAKFSNHNVIHGVVGGTIWDLSVFPPTDIPDPLGTMVFVSTPYDPVFWLLHSNVDRLWAEWQANGHEGSDFYPAEGQPYGHNLNDRMWPWDGGQSVPANMGPGKGYKSLLPVFAADDVVTPADTLDYKKYDYTYDTFESTSVPEPTSTVVLLCLGASGSAFLLKRKHKPLL